MHYGRTNSLIFRVCDSTRSSTTQVEHQKENDEKEERGRTRTALGHHNESSNHQPAETSRQSDREIRRLQSILDDKSLNLAGMDTGTDGPKNHHLLQIKGRDPCKMSLRASSLPSKETIPRPQEYSECRDPRHTNERFCRGAPSSSNERNALDFMCGQVQCTDLRKEGDAIDSMFEHVKSSLCHHQSDSLQQGGNDSIYADNSPMISRDSSRFDSVDSTRRLVRDDSLNSQRIALSGGDGSSLQRVQVGRTPVNERVQVGRTPVNERSKGNSIGKNICSSFVISIRGKKSSYEANELGMEIVYYSKEWPRVEKSKSTYEAREIGMEIVYHPREGKPKQKQRSWRLFAAK